MGLQRISGYKVGGGAFDTVTIEKTITVSGDANLDEGTLFVDDSENRVGVGGNTTPKTALDVVFDYGTEAFESQLAAGEGGGDVLKLGTGTTVASQLYFLHTDGSWDSADADDVDLGGSQVLGIALGTAPATHGMLLRGFIRIDAAKIAGTPTAGSACYVSEDPTKAVDFVAPSGSDDYVRILGYCLDVDSGNALIYFNPSADVIELA